MFYDDDYAIMSALFTRVYADAAAVSKSVLRIIYVKE